MRWIAILLAVVALGAGPETKPTTRPDTAALARAVVDARYAVGLAKHSAVSKLAGTTEYKAAATIAESKRVALEEARANGSPAEKITASSEYVKSLAAMDKLKADAIASDKGISEAVAAANIAEKALTDAKDRIDHEMAEAEEKRENSPIRIAIRKHQILKGMTEQDVIASMNISSNPNSGAIWQAGRDTSTLDTGETVYRYRIGYSSPGNRAFVVTRKVSIVMKDGVVVSFSQTRKDFLDNEP